MADAAITALACEGVTNPQGAGLGGGFLMTIFIAETGTVEFLNARDRAPGKASEDMFADFSDDATIFGGRAAGIPGEVKGYWALHQKYGKLKWSRLFEPMIELCRRGHLVNSYMAGVVQRRVHILKDSPSLKELLINPETNETYKDGDIMKHPQLAETLQLIAEEGAATLYDNGTLGKRLIEDIQEDGGIMTIEDLMNYEVRWQKAVEQKVGNNKTLYTSSFPGSGSLVAFILNVLNDYLPGGPVLQSYQRIVETFKYAYALRSLLGGSEDGAAVERNLTRIDYAMNIRSKLDDHHTMNDYKYYGGIYESGDVSTLH